MMDVGDWVRIIVTIVNISLGVLIWRLGREQRAGTKALDEARSLHEDMRIALIEVNHGDHVHIDFLTGDDTIAVLTSSPVLGRRIVNTIMREGLADATRVKECPGHE